MINRAKRKLEGIVIPLYDFHLLRNIQTFILIFYICDGYLVFETAAHGITRLLRDEVYLPLRIIISLDINASFTADLS